MPLVAELMPSAWPCLYLKVLALITTVLNGILESVSFLLTEIICTSYPLVATDCFTP